MYVLRRSTSARPHAAAWLLMLAGLAAGCSDGVHHDEPPAPPATPTPPAIQPVARQQPRPTGPLALGTSCTSAGCHADYTQAASVHGVLRGSEGCAVCHEPDAGGHLYPLKRPGAEGCTYCHETVIGQRVHQHQATEVACLVCHDPHASEHATLLRDEPVATLCATCHPASHPDFPHPPGAADQCSLCHDPHESDFPALLRGGMGTDHCALCHEDLVDSLATAKTVHPPAGQECIACHDPHGTDRPALLAHEVDEHCFSCHQDIETLVAGAEAPHGALSTQGRCANCHDPHASNEPSLLKDRQDVLCLGCHDTAITAVDGRTIPDMSPSVRGRTFLHGPVKTGDCTACHSVHGGTHSRLLREEFTSDFYASFDLRNYALCFQCHEQELVTVAETNALTSFRNGDQNLHFLHVNRDKKGRTCRTCHEIHGSDLPFHVAETVPFEGSGWALPIGFEPTATGGSCSPGCHKPYGYDRIDPVVYPSPASPPRKEEDLP